MINHLIEKELVDKFCDRTMVDKIFWNIQNETNETFTNKHIPRLLETTFYELVREESWAMVKYINANKIRSIDFKNLKQHTFNKVKEFYPQLFRRSSDERI